MRKLASVIKISSINFEDLFEEQQYSVNKKKD